MTPPSAAAPAAADPPPALGPHDDVDLRASARHAWALLAPLIAGQPRIRVSRDRRSYPQRWETALTPVPPPMPAAVRLYGRDGAARCLAADLDVARGGVQQVEADSVALTELVARCGGRSVADCSPSGGRHVYVLLAEPVPYGEMRRAALALARLLPSLDASSLLNLTAGCIRPPGAAHKTGGAQQLLTPLDAARQAAAAPNPPQVWTRLLDALAPQLRDLDDGAGDRDRGGEDDIGLVDGRVRGLSARMSAIARTGVHGYHSGSEARLAVLTAAAGAGWALRDVVRHLETGAWPGLASFYARYRPRHRAAAIGRDWRKAAGHVAPKKLVRKDDTSPPIPHPAQVTRPQNATTANDHQFVRRWRNALTAVEVARYGESRAGLGRRMVLRALAQAAHLTGSRYVEFGCRSLAYAGGMDHSTVATHLRDLASEPDPFVRLVETRRGVRGDLYELVIPEAAAHTERRAWPAGQVHAVRPAFRELGLPAAFAYEQLERAARPLSRFDVATRAGLSAAAAADALRILAEHGLAIRGRDGWRLGRASLRALAEVFGVLELLAAIRARYAVERAAWRATLAGWRREHPALQQQTRASRAPPPRSSPVEPPPGEPPEDPVTTLDLLERVLGAHVVEPD
jgi:hypothetical protein